MPALEADIKAAAEAIDYHTVENRERRKAMQERRNQLAKDMKAIARDTQQRVRRPWPGCFRASRAPCSLPSMRRSGHGRRQI